MSCPPPHPHACVVWRNGRSDGLRRWEGYHYRWAPAHTPHPLYSPYTSTHRFTQLRQVPLDHPFASVLSCLAEHADLLPLHSSEDLGGHAVDTATPPHTLPAPPTTHLKLGGYLILLGLHLPTTHLSKKRGGMRGGRRGQDLPLLALLPATASAFFAHAPRSVVDLNIRALRAARALPPRSPYARQAGWERENLA